MSCPSLLHRRPEATELIGGPDAHGGPTHPGDDGFHDLVHTAAERVRRDDTLGQFIRFVLVGSSSTALYALLFLSLGSLGYLTAHVVGTVASSVLANELHRRLTFRADERVGWLAAQVEAGGVSLFGLLASSVALGWLDSVVGDAAAVLQITLVATITGLIGLMRFVALRWIFRPTEAALAQ